MARTIQIELYPFNELSDEAQRKAIESMRDINTDYEWWDSVYYTFETVCSSIGIDVDLKKTYFRGFCSQGDGACFTAPVKILELIEGIDQKRYLEENPWLKEEVRSFTPKRCTVSARILDLVRREWIDFYVSIRANDRPYASRCRCEWSYQYNLCVNYKNIDQHLMELESWVEDIVGELDNLLYRMLENEYEEQTSDEMITTSIIENNCEFTEDGLQCGAHTQPEIIKKMAA